MDQAELLHQMCQAVLSQADIKAICKTRGLPAQAASSRSVLETLFVSDTGLAAAFEGLDLNEIALLHLLKAIGKPVDVSFFSRLDLGKTERFRYGTFTQRYQGVLAKVKERMVRRGILLLALGRHSRWMTSQMERWLFALPAQFAPHLPSVVEAPRRLAGEGDWRSSVVATKLTTATAMSSKDEAKGDTLEIVDRELRLGGKPFRAASLLDWQLRRWKEETAPAEQGKAKDKDPYALSPAEAVLGILGGLDAGSWSDAGGLAVPLEIFCGAKIDGEKVCESGWRWGCLARQEADGKTWYCVAPRAPAADVPPHRYLDVTADGTVTIDLQAVPLEALEQIVTISDQRPAPSGRPALLLAPNLIKLGRMADTDSTLPMIDWLQKNSFEFRQAIETQRQRSGKTILHENLAVARVSDLALKVAIEKTLGHRIVSLGDEYIAFPHELVGNVKRVVTKSGHVVKEASIGEA